jgi:hypothetical protein
MVCRIGFIVFTEPMIFVADMAVTGRLQFFVVVDCVVFLHSSMNMMEALHQHYI